MKTVSLFLIIFSMYSVVYVNAQTENPDSKNLTKEERKALKKAKKEEDKRKREEALKIFEKYAEARTWVIEAHTVFNKQGQSFQMDPTINFVGVNGDETTVQLSFTGLVGWNGVGGITLDGKIGKYQFTNNDKVVAINLGAMGSGMGVVDMHLTITGDGNARATVKGNWGDQITFQGRFVSLAESRVYKGSPTY